MNKIISLDTHLVGDGFTITFEEVMGEFDKIGIPREMLQISPKLSTAIWTKAHLDFIEASLIGYPTTKTKRKALKQIAQAIALLILRALEDMEAAGDVPSPQPQPKPNKNIIN